jgi:hypothetical protein
MHSHMGYKQSVTLLPADLSSELTIWNIARLRLGTNNGLFIVLLTGRLKEDSVLLCWLWSDRINALNGPACDS